jgi:hypothetical protein
VKQIGRYLVSRILSVKEARQVRDVSQAKVPSVCRWSTRGPFHCRGNADVCFAPLGSEQREGAQVSRLVAKLIAESLAKPYVPFNVRD